MFWLGAGVSATAGIPMAGGMVDRLLDRLWRDGQTSTSLRPYSDLSTKDQLERRAEVRRWAIDKGLVRAHMGGGDWGHLYSHCLGLLGGEAARQEFIVECVQEGKGRLNCAHLYLAQLMYCRFVKIVLTTNFDDLLLRALNLYWEYPAVLDADSSLQLEAKESKFLQVAYLHGKLTSYRQRHTKSEVKKTIPAFEGFLHQSLQRRGLVVTGYRGGDETPMAMLCNVLRKRGAGPGHGLYWCSYNTDFGQLAESVQSLLRIKDVYWVQELGLGCPTIWQTQRRLRVGWRTSYPRGMGRRGGSSVPLRFIRSQFQRKEVS
jgi:hypothetical protein